MTDILCRWLNEDLQLEKSISKKRIHIECHLRFLLLAHDSFAAEISNGYLIGMILHQNGLQVGTSAIRSPIFLVFRMISAISLKEGNMHVYALIMYMYCTCMYGCINLTCAFQDVRC